MSGTPALASRAGGALRIGRARLHKAMPGDRERLALGLDGVRPAAVGVPDRAILIVPRLVARKPLSRNGDGGQFAGDVVERLRNALRRARRPGEARSAEDSLVFTDDLDAAACLIAQWLAGAPPAERVWWPCLTAGSPPPVWWRRELLPDGRRLPSLIAVLARRGLAETWLKRLDSADLRIGLAAIAAVHGVRLPAVAETPVRPRRRKARSAAPEGPGARAAALIESVAPEAARADLPPQARLLLLLGLLAERRPASLKTTTTRAALAAVAGGRPLPADPKPVARRGGRRRPPALGVERRTAPTRSGEAERRLVDSPGVVLEPVPAEGRAPARESRGLLPQRLAEAGRGVVAEGRIEAAGVGIGTEFGGVMFLLNVLLALGIYGDFTQPKRGLPGLSPFGLLRILGRAWFGAEFRGDPLDRLLTGLAGAEAAREFDGPPWSVPRSWLRPWPKPGPALIGGGMLWHPAHFPLVAVGRSDPAAAARRLGLKGKPVRARLPALPRPRRARWIACLRYYLEARIAKALGCADGTEAVALLCRRPARILADPERIEARFDLDHHPLAIRMAGLDRDPGWIPAARRDFRLVFE